MKTIMIDDTEYNVDDLTDENKTMINEINHARKETDRLIYMAEVLKARTSALGKALADAINKKD